MALSMNAVRAPVSSLTTPKEVEYLGGEGGEGGEDQASTYPKL